MGYDWNDTFHSNNSSPRHKRILEEGDYDFKVVDFMRGHVKSGSSAGANQAIYTLLIDGEYVRYYLPLIEKVQWKVEEFFEGIGIRIDGRKIPWNDAVGRNGRCRVRPRQYGDSSTFNDVAKVWPSHGYPEPQSPSPAPSYQQTGASDSRQASGRSMPRGSYGFDDIPF